jgi:hypothetical protein
MHAEYQPETPQEVGQPLQDAPPTDDSVTQNVPAQPEAETKAEELDGDVDDPTE